jgi:ABC-2 type transport system ATP-binding protein
MPPGLDDAAAVHDLVIEPGAGAGDPVRLRFDVESDHLAAVVQLLAPCGVIALRSEPPTLEELFVRHYAGQEP